MAHAALTAIANAFSLNNAYYFKLDRNLNNCPNSSNTIHIIELPIKALAYLAS